jgi:hypothetical protein
MLSSGAAWRVNGTQSPELDTVSGILVQVPAVRQDGIEHF